MKRVLILCLIMVLSCQKEEKTNFTLEGNWSLIDIDSTYYELYIRNDSIITYHEDLSFLPLKTYLIKDSIFYLKQGSGNKGIYY